MEEQQPRHDVIANPAWVVDSGATFDTVPLGYANQEDLQRIPLMTPLRSTRHTVQLLLSTVWSCSYLGCPSMFVPQMPDSPALMSVGRRCMVHGYSFIWMAGREPYFITRDASSIIPCAIRAGVPYLDPDEPKCKPRAFDTHG